MMCKMDSFVYNSYTRYGDQFSDWNYYATVKSGVYVGGRYYYLTLWSEGSYHAKELSDAICFSNWMPITYKRVCETCNKDCGNIHCSGDCCSWEEITGTVNSRWG